MQPTEDQPLLIAPSTGAGANVEGGPVAEEGLRVEKVRGQASRPASVPSAIFNTTNTIIGGGVLALPFAFANAGLVVGVVLVVLIACLSWLTSHYLATLTKHCLRSSGRSYRSVAQVAFGTPGAFAVDLCFIVFLFGGCVGYVVIMGDILTPYFEQLAGWSPKAENRWLVEAVVTFCFAYPLSLLKKIDMLKYTSLAALLCICYLVIVIVVESISIIADNFEQDNVLLASASLNLFQAFPVITFAFTFHMQQFAIQNEMKQPGRIRLVVASAIAFSMVCYLFVGIFGYLAFFESAASNILLSFDDNPAIIVGKIALVFVIMFSFPVLHFPLRQAVMSLLFPQPDAPSCYDWLPARCVPEYRKGFLTLGSSSSHHASSSSDQATVGEYPSDAEYYSPDDFESFEAQDLEPDESAVVMPCVDDMIRHVVVTTVVVYVVYLAAIAIPDISTIFGLVGATVGTALVFVIPPIMIIKLEPGPILSFQKITCLILAIVGTFFGIIGTYETIANW